MIDTGNTAWMLTSAVLVLLMTLPGLALFYAGLVQSRNALSVLMHCIVVACLVSLLWFAIGYTLAFDAGGPLLCGLGRTFLLGMAPGPAAVSALVIACVIGKRRASPHDVTPPHAPWMVMVGASLLWVGWFGFNAGSALAANADAGMAMLATHLSAATASLVWMGIEWT